MLAVAGRSFAQGGEFTFSPGDQYDGIATAEMYTEHVVYVYPNSEDIVNITWRVIGNTCPDGWDFQMCDWQHCYDGFPNTAEMDPVPSGGSGYLKLLVNPFNIGGSGDVHFWVYPTDSIEQRQDVVFHFNSTTAVADIPKGNVEEFRIVDQQLVISKTSPGEYLLFDLHGRVVAGASCIQDVLSIDLSALPVGIYVVLTPQRNCFKFLKP